MLKFYITIAFALPFICLAQNKISGSVINAADQKTVADASVFLSNATNGNKTATDGTFLLSGVKNGQYDLVVSCIGFEPFHQSILINNADIALPPILLPLKSMLLKEVSIRPDPDHWLHYNVFKNEFIGQSDNARFCKILNPDAVYLSFNKKTNVLNGNSDDFLQIENKALGYKVSYLLNSFIKDNKAAYIYYAGSALFEPLNGKPGDQKRWEKKRSEAYIGSLKHFLQACLRFRFEEEGFKVFKLIRTPNPQRPPDSMINARINYFSAQLATVGSYSDSLSYWQEKFRLFRFSESIVKTPLKLEDFVRRTDQKGIYALSFKDCLFVRYTKKSDADTKLTLTENYAFFDSNGVVLNPTGLICEGYWGLQRMAELLPVDYEAPAKN